MRQENCVPLLGNCGNFDTDPDMAGACSRVYSQIGLARFREIGRRLEINLIFNLQNAHMLSRRLRDPGLFLPPPVYDCVLLAPSGMRPLRNVHGVSML